MFDDEIWDEHRWEAFLSENDRHAARRLGLFYDYLADHPRPTDPVKREKWAADFRTMLLVNGFREDDPLLSLIDPDASPMDDARWAGAAFEDDADDESDAGAPPDDVPVYARAFDLSADVLRWSEQLPIADKDSTFVNFCASITQIPGDLAKGHGIGFERDMIGGNIACAKRALNAANDALRLLQHLRGNAFLSELRYHRLYERVFDLRNDIGIYVQTLRDRFDLGID